MLPQTTDLRRNRSRHLGEIKDKELICLDCILPQCKEGHKDCLYTNPKKEESMGQGGDLKAKGKENEARKEEIIACVQKYHGKIKPAAIELGMKQSTVAGLYKKWTKHEKPAQDPPGPHIELMPWDAHKLPRSKPFNTFRSKEELVTLFEKVLQQPTIEAANACWAGIKLAKGVE